MNKRQRKKHAKRLWHRTLKRITKDILRMLREPSPILTFVKFVDLPPTQES